MNLKEFELNEAMMVGLDIVLLCIGNQKDLLQVIIVKVDEILDDDQNTRN